MDKVKFNIKNVHYAPMNEEGETWEKPVAIPGAVSFSLAPVGEVTKFYADGVLYYTCAANNGYEGDLEMAMFPAHFLKSIYGVTEGTTSKVLIENANARPKPFALLFEEEGDSAGTMFVLYNCTATRPERSFETTGENKDPSTSKISVTVGPMLNGNVLAMTQDDTPAETKNKWYDAVYEEGK